MYSPGSFAARNLGCTCGEVANNFGCGDGGSFVVSQDCPMHGATVWGAHMKQGVPPSLPKSQQKPHAYPGCGTYGALAETIYFDRILLDVVPVPSISREAIDAVAGINEELKKDL